MAHGGGTFLKDNPMNDDTHDLDQADDDVLAYAVSDEAVEAAAGAWQITVSGLTVYLTNPRDFCC